LDQSKLIVQDDQGEVPHSEAIKFLIAMCLCLLEFIDILLQNSKTEMKLQESNKGRSENFGKLEVKKEGFPKT